MSQKHHHFWPVTLLADRLIQNAIPLCVLQSRTENDPWNRIQPSRTQRKKSFVYKSFLLSFPAADSSKGFVKLMPPEQRITVWKRLCSFHLLYKKPSTNTCLMRLSN